MTNTLTLKGKGTSHSSGYDRISRVNHWLAAAGFLAALCLGLTMAYGGLPRDSIGVLMNWHKALGILVFAFGLWRVAWRLAQGFPEPVAGIPGWQEKAAKLIHLILLATIILMPLSGVVMTLSGGRDLSLWDATILPSPGTIEWLSDSASWLHGTLGLLITGIVTLHILAALKHHLVDRDATLRRMLSGAA